MNETDIIDIKIIECLKANSRENASVIGGKVNMSVSAVIERIKKLETSGIVKQYTAVLDNEKLGLNITAFVSVNLENPKQKQEFLGFAVGHPQIIECHSVTGEFDFLLKVCTENTKTLESLLDSLKSIGGVGQTQTLVALSTEKEIYSADIVEEE